MKKDKKHAKNGKHRRDAERDSSHDLDLELIAQSRVDGRQQIAEARLLRFKNRTMHRRYVIDMTSPEFTCMCPVSGFPDFATIQIQFVPKDWCVELKSLKLYINQYRDHGIYHEDVTNKIMDDLVALLDPWEIKVLADFQVRGNIKTLISATHAHPKCGDERLVVRKSV